MLDAATVVCLRPNPNFAPSLQVLLGQNQVKNWLRSTEDDDVPMRYPGEWKFPGGVRDESDEDLKCTAIRELKEEFIGLPISEDMTSTLKLFNKKVTLPVRGKQYCMHNFISLFDDNSWMVDEAVVHCVNENLENKLTHFECLIANGAFWQLILHEKERFAPEVRHIQWVKLDVAIARMRSATSTPTVFLDEWQRSEFIKYNIEMRDPMTQTMLVS